MAKGKKKSRRQGLFSKAINIAFLALGFSRPLFLLLRPGGFSQSSVEQILEEATFGLTKGTFDVAAGARMYSPAGAAFALGTLKTFLMRKFPVR